MTASQTGKIGSQNRSSGDPLLCRNRGYAPINASESGLNSNFATSRRSNSSSLKESSSSSSSSSSSTPWGSSPSRRSCSSLMGSGETAPTGDGSAADDGAVGRRRRFRLRLLPGSPPPAARAKSTRTKPPPKGREGAMADENVAARPLFRAAAAMAAVLLGSATPHAKVDVGDGSSNSSVIASPIVILTSTGH